MNTQLSALRTRIADIEAERIAMKESEMRPLYDRLRELGDVITRTDAVLFGNHPPHWQDEKQAKKERSAAMSERGEINAKLQLLQLQESNISRNLPDLKRKLQQAEYEAVSVEELEDRVQEIVSSIRFVDGQLASLKSEHCSLAIKQQEALSTNATIKGAEDEVWHARVALEKLQSDSFIADRPADLAPYQARVGKAEKHLEAAKQSTMAARAALPRISARLEAIQAERESLEQDRKTHVAGWWANRQRLEEINYRTQVHGLVDSLQTLVALDKHTGNNLGGQLLDRLRHGLRVPLMGKYIEEVDFSSWFGGWGTPDVASTLTQLETELSAAIASSPVHLPNSI